MGNFSEALAAEVKRLRDVLQRLPTQLNSRIDELLPHQWTPDAPVQTGSA